MKHGTESWKSFFSGLVFDVFFTSFFLFIVSFFLEGVRKGIIVNFLNLKVILLICILSGAISVFFPVHRERQKGGVLQAALFLPWGVIAGTLAYLYSPDGWQWKYLFAAGSGAAAYFILFIISNIQLDEAS